MIVLEITDVKGFMGKLLRDGVFDSFELRSVVIESLARFEIHGAKPADEGMPAEYNSWGSLRKYVYEIIKGESTPRIMKVVLGLSSEKMQTSFPNSAALFVNIHFEGGKITVISGQSPKSFSFEKQDELRWDESLKAFLNKNGITFADNL